MATPGIGPPAGSRTKPRATQARSATIEPGISPFCTGFEPENRKAVALAKEVVSVVANIGAMVAGSGGSPLMISRSRKWEAAEVA